MAGFANDVVYANNGDFSIAGSNKGSLANGLLTNGQMWIGSTSLNAGGTHINVGSFISPDFSIIIGYSSPNITLQASSSLIKIINGDTGSITGSTVTIFANNATLNSGASVKFVNSGTVSTLNLTDVNNNTLLGKFSGNLSGGFSENVGLGGCLQSVTSSSENVAIGNGVLNTLTGPMGGAGGNTAVGFSAASLLVDGTDNVCIGANCGSAYTGSESVNILLGSPGVIGDSRVLRLGNTDAMTGQSTCYVAGVTGVTISSSAPIAVDTNGQLSSLGFGTATQVLTSNGAGVSPTWQAAGGGGASTTFFAYVSSSIVNPTGDGTPYTVIFDSTLNNTGSAYATGTGLFTAPATGMYHFDTCIAFNAIQATSTTVVIQFNGSAISVRPLQIQGATTALVEGLLCYSGGITVPMTAADTMSVLVNVGGVAKNVSLFGSGVPAGASTVFSGYRVS